MPTETTQDSTVISPCGLYRYRLSRNVDYFPGESTVNFILLGSANDEPTIHRCVDYAERWGYGDLVVTSLFASCLIGPRCMPTWFVIGPENDHHILEAASKADLVVCAWGVQGTLHGRSNAVVRILAQARIEMHCLTRTFGGEPGHPLRLPRYLLPIPFRPAAAREARTA